MSDESGDNPFDVVAEVSRLAHRAAAGQLDRSAFLAEFARAIARLSDLSPAVRDDVGPYLDASLGVVDAGMNHILNVELPLDAARYRALDVALGNAVRRGHLHTGPDETARHLRAAGLLPGDWRPSPTRADGQPPPSVLRGEYLDEDEGDTGPVPVPTDRPRPTRPGALPSGPPWWASMQLLGLGWVIVLVMVGGVLLGVWADGQLGTSPLGLLVGVVLAAAVAYRAARNLVRQATGHDD